MIKVIYEWGRRTLRRIEIFQPEDTAKKMEIPSESKMAKVHERLLKIRRKQHHGR